MSSMLKFDHLSIGVRSREMMAASGCVAVKTVGDEAIVSSVRCTWMRDQETKKYMQGGKAW